MNAPALAALMAFVATAGQAAPLSDYRIHCMGCHLSDGGGTPGKVPPLRGSVDRFLEHPGGRAYLVRVPGVAHAKLADAELADLLNWMIESFGAAGRQPSPAFSASEVKRLRQRPLQAPQLRRAEILATERVPERTGPAVPIAPRARPAAPRDAACDPRSGANPELRPMTSCAGTSGHIAR